MTPHPVDMDALESLFKEWKAARFPNAPWPMEPAPEWWNKRDKLFVAAVNALPALLAEVRAGRQALADVKRDCELCDWTCEMCGHDYGMTETDLYRSAVRALASPSVPTPQEKVQEAGETPAPPPGAEAIRLLRSAAEVLRFYAVDRRGSPLATAIDGSLAAGLSMLTAGDISPVPLPEEQLPKEGGGARIVSWTCHICDAGGTAIETMYAHFTTHGIGASAFDRRYASGEPTAGPPEGSAAAPAPGDADRVRGEELCRKAHDEALSCVCTEIAAELARVRSEEREACESIARRKRAEHLKNMGYANAARDFATERLDAVSADACESIARLIRARASDATSAGGGD